MMKVNVGSILVLDVHTCGDQCDNAVWEVTGIKLGGEGQQNVIELRALHRTENGELRVPEELIKNMIACGYKRDLIVVN